MESKLYNEVNSDKKVLRTVHITEEQAESLNVTKKARGTTYVLKAEKSNEFQIEGIDYDIKAFKAKFNEIEGVKKISANTGVVKTLERFEELDEESKEILIESLK